MEHISNSIDKVLVNLMVRCMLNPNNKGFYIGNLTLNRLQELFTNMESNSFVDIFWSAYSIASNIYLEEKECDTDEDIINIEYSYPEGCCPKCGCEYYQGYSRCPNCDYED